MPDSLNELFKQLDQAMLLEQHLLRARLHRLKKQKQLSEKTITDIQSRLHKSVQLRQQRAASVIKPEYPTELPVSEKREVIADAIRKNQVVIVCGETGSGKTTQLPKICLELGLGVAGTIGHTQPRRIAARSVCARIADELYCEVGQQVGYKVRFDEQLGDNTLIKLMTDGMLLNETVHDRYLYQYDTLIIDEAHERSLNIDFLLGYIKHILPRRPDLKVIITSATIDPERFSAHFNDAPIIEVSGRTYPVEIRYRPLVSADEDEEDRDMLTAIVDTVKEISRIDNGDILVFLPGERDIREAKDVLEKAQLRSTEVLPLFSRLSKDEQARIFKRTGQRHIILATNIAETSLTVPGIRYVIDTGSARISRYSHRLKIQRLPIEKISQASARQRAGRCGRVSAGICYRLYAQDDHDGREEFTQPEILRTNLAAVILQMHALKLGRIEAFPFMEPPDSRFIRDGVRQLHELGAIDEHAHLTKLGWQLAKLPIDPRVGRMLLAAHEHHCMTEMLIIASALETQDPRDRPMDRQQAADEAHAQFHDRQSDFVAILNLWRYLDEQSSALSGNQFRKLCKRQFISWMRLREWRDTHQQLRQIVKEMGLRFNQKPADYESLHKALLSGLLGHIGNKDDDQSYRGARNSRFHIFPGSGLMKKQPAWVVAAEIVETTRIYARTVGRVEPEWIEQAGIHLLHYEYLEPHWRRRRGYVAVQEKARLYGLVVSGERYVNLASKDPALAREIFIRRALVEQDYDSRAPFWKHNQQLIKDIESLENRQRRRDVLVGEEDFFRFYDERLPAHVHGHCSLEKWRKQQEKANPRVLFMTREDLMQHEAADVTAELYPETLELHGNRFALEYHFTPGHEVDGVSVRIPLYLLASVNTEDFEWLVPGLLEDKITALIRSLPKPIRRRFVPVPDYAHACMQALDYGQDSLLQQLSYHLNRMSGQPVSVDDFHRDQIPEYLHMRYVVTDDNGRTLADGRDLSALQHQLDRKLTDSIDQLKDSTFEREGITEWDFGELPEQHVVRKGKQRITLYPSLWDCRDSISLSLCSSKEEADIQTRWGIVRLCMMTLNVHHRELKKRFKLLSKHCLVYSALSDNNMFYQSDELVSCDELIQQAIYKTFEQTFIVNRDLPRSRDQFDRLCNEGRGQLQSNAEGLLNVLDNIFDTWKALYPQIQELPEDSDIRKDIDSQLHYLVYRGFVETTSTDVLSEIPRYLKAIDRRIERFRHSPDRDNRLSIIMQPCWQRYLKRLIAFDEQGFDVFDLSGIHWALEEFRVSLFAQELGTKQRVSEKRIRQLFEN